MEKTTHWWQNIDFLTSCLGNINAANQKEFAIDACSYLFKAFRLARDEFFKEEDAHLLFASLIFSNFHDMENLALADPVTLNYQVLLDEGFTGDRSITSDLKHKATREARLFKSAWKNYQSNSNEITQKTFEQKFEDLLKTIENNVSYHDNMAEIAARENFTLDQRAYGIIESMLKKLFENLFERPQNRLAAYGTLRPGQSNYHIVDTIGGDWTEGIITGTLEDKYGYPYFTWQTSENKVKVDILESENLPDHWQRLDQFEGQHYRRILIPVETESGLKVCNVYNGC